MNSADKIYNFLINFDEEGLNHIKKMFYTQISKQSYQILYQDKDDLLNDFITYKLIPKRKEIAEKFSQSTDGLVSYISIAIENFLKTEITKKIYKSEMFQNSVYYNQEEDEKEDTFERVLETTQAKEYDVLVKIEAEDIYNKLIEELKDTEKQLLCYLISEEQLQSYIKENFFKDISEDAFYKRIERLKKKLSSIAQEYGYSQEGFEEAFNTFYTQICKNYKG
ncbi:hypothetical protein [Sulfurihydrogenibium azorense]|uniref:Uncharacterized protein n=1 Tax=Sulfurihydrogenibium azorense (strain DSM 15241 / OCM 825 / Az-Fu1) TaxID=204536 RepID=C1DV81_SULAA|nr:hypothetical protein [Sulfurihydrogenibium azorense]ACN99769.1 hypothetical protein SULAZ_1045 [Sulfurihydrogenibium azorense Az-Fu1]